MVQKLMEDSKNKDIRNIVPRMALSITEIKVARGESLTTDPQLTHVKEINPVLSQTMKNGVPIKVSYVLSVVFNKLHEGFNILEYIISRFRPSLNIPIFETAMGIKRDIDVILEDITTQYSTEMLPGNNRISIHQISLSTATWVYPPIYDQGVIKYIDIDWIDYDNEDLVYFTNTWEVEPRAAESDDPHTQILKHVENQGEETETSTTMISEEMN